SSDVCSSDLIENEFFQLISRLLPPKHRPRHRNARPNILLQNASRCPLLNLMGFANKAKQRYCPLRLIDWVILSIQLLFEYPLFSSKDWLGFQSRLIWFYCSVFPKYSRDLSYPQSGISTRIFHKFW